MGGSRRQRLRPLRNSRAPSQPAASGSQRWSRAPDAKGPTSGCQEDGLARRRAGASVRRPCSVTPEVDHAQHQKQQERERGGDEQRPHAAQSVGEEDEHRALRLPGEPTRTQESSADAIASHFSSRSPTDAVVLPSCPRTAVGRDDSACARGGEVCPFHAKRASPARLSRASQRQTNTRPDSFLATTHGSWNPHASWRDRGIPFALGLRGLHWRAVPYGMTMLKPTSLDGSAEPRAVVPPVFAALRTETFG